MELDDKLIQEALQLGEHSTIYEIDAALREYINKRRQREIVDSFGTIKNEFTYS